MRNNGGVAVLQFMCVSIPYTRTYVCVYMCSMTAWCPPYRQQRDESSQHQDAVDKMAGRLEETVSACSRCTYVRIYTPPYIYTYVYYLMLHIRTY